MHDAFFKTAFGRPDVARSEIALVLPPEVSAHLDLGTLAVTPGSFVDDELRQAHTDLLYTVHTRDGHETLVYVLFEHQSSFDELMPFRLLRYMVRVWERWLGDHAPTTRLPVILPVVLHHGPHGWRTAPELASMLDASPAFLDATRDLQPHFRFLLDDLGLLTLNELALRTLGAFTHLVQFALWSSRSYQRLKDAAPLMRAIRSKLGGDERTREQLSELLVYMWQAAEHDVDVEAVRTILVDIAGPDGREDVMNAGEQLIQQGVERGVRSSIEAVMSARGVTLSERSRAKIAACHDVSTLKEWLARAATAPSEAEVFAGA